VSFVCASCGEPSARYAPECPACGVPNALRSMASTMREGRPRAAPLQANAQPIVRVKTGLGTLDVALGGGFVKGASYILTGAPGAGKSTLGLLIAEALMPKVLYVGVEEKLIDYERRAARTGRGLDVPLLITQSVSHILAEAESTLAEVLLVDQLHALDGSHSSQGALENMKRLIRFAKDGRSVLLVAERTHAGVIRGGRSMAYAVDATLSIEKPALVEGVAPPPPHVLQQRWLTTTKNRHGPDGSWSLMLGEHGWAELPPEKEMRDGT
jgi:DNA repair protein RadA/Sms